MSVLELFHKYINAFNNYDWNTIETLLHKDCFCLYPYEGKILSCDGRDNMKPGYLTDFEGKEKVHFKKGPVESINKDGLYEITVTLISDWRRKELEIIYLWKNNQMITHTITYIKDRED